MDSAEQIRDAVRRVELLRQVAAGKPSINAAVTVIKELQSRRFAGTYSDLAGNKSYEPAVRFFLDQLYGTEDFSDRDKQFSRIAGAMQKLLPAHAVSTACALATLHVQTEQLDHTMAQTWISSGHSLDPKTQVANYIAVWRAVGLDTERRSQLEGVLEIGRELTRLTRLPGLRLTLKLMRAPAAAAGLAGLQQFLEIGFDAFKHMSRRTGVAEGFLAQIEARESQWIERLNHADTNTCEAELIKALGRSND